METQSISYKLRVRVYACKFDRALQDRESKYTHSHAHGSAQGPLHGINTRFGRAGEGGVVDNTRRCRTFASESRESDATGTV